MRPVLLHLYPFRIRPRRMREAAFWYYQNIAGYTSQALKTAILTTMSFMASGVVVGQKSSNHARFLFPLVTKRGNRGKQQHAGRRYKSRSCCWSWLLSPLCFYTGGLRRQRRYHSWALFCRSSPAPAFTVAFVFQAIKSSRRLRPSCPACSSAALHNVVIRPSDSEVRSELITTRYVKAGQAISSLRGESVI